MLKLQTWAVGITQMIRKVMYMHVNQNDDRTKRLSFEIKFFSYQAVLDQNLPIDIFTLSVFDLIYDLVFPM